MAPFSVGLRKDQTSGYEKFEGPDPADWVNRGYAIINVDVRGVGSSGGDAVFWGQQEAEDVYDTIEGISKQPWCNGSVGMCGNSWLAITQVNLASRLQHPALKTLAPWEGRIDVYCNTLSRGGRKHNPSLHKFLMAGFAGPNMVEDMPAMLNKRPLYDDYWASRYIHTENINMPPYITGSCIDNGWERDTPKVRISLLGFESGGSSAKAVSERPEGEYPFSRQELKTFYLDAMTKKVEAQAVQKEAITLHVSNDNKSTSDFTLYFDKYTEIDGYAKAHLWVSCGDHDDLDIAVNIRKISKDGKPLDHLNYPCPVPIEEVPSFNTSKCVGQQGFLRASHSVTKVGELYTDQEICYQHDRREPIKPGAIVPVDITLWPMGMVFEASEHIMLRITNTI